MDKQTSSPLPPLYAGWFDELLGGDIPAETRATCQDCAMCDDEAEYQKPGSKFFNPQTKCCTYLPRLPNYLVGMILADDDPAMANGRQTIEARLQAEIAVTPLGLEQPLMVKVLYEQKEIRAFGRAQSLICSHYINEQGGRCGIWKYRNSVCSTWFCKYVRGAVGRDFWEAAKFFLLSIEAELSRWCAIKLAFNDQEFSHLFVPQTATSQLPPLTLEDLDNLVDAEKQRRIWGNWYGREREFYLACAERVAALSWQEILEICGPAVQMRARLVQEAYRRLMTGEIPERLRIGNFTITETDQDFCSLYHPGIGVDVFRLSTKVMRLLPYFDGRPTREILQQIIEKEGLRFTTELLRRLVDFNILVAVDG